jgi:hypothetical protein
MNCYRIERPVKWKGEILKQGHVEAAAEDIQPLIDSGALVQELTATLAGVVKPDGAEMDLDDMKVDELKALAKDLEVKGYADMRKAELIAAIKAEPVQVDA